MELTHSPSRNLMAGAGRFLKENGRLFVYGPFKRGGNHTAPSNAQFDAALRAENPEWGVRDVDDLNVLAQDAKLTAAELALIKSWIEAGAPFPAPAAPAPAIARAVHDTEMLQAMSNHLATVPANRRRFQRYFSLANIANDPATGEGDLRLYRAALSKVINSLTWESTVVLPKPIDTQKTLFAIDVSDLGWDRRNLWDEVLKQYPYGLTHKYDSDAKVPGVFRFEALLLSVPDADPKTYKNPDCDQNAVCGDAKSADLKETGKHLFT